MQRSLAWVTEMLTDWKQFHRLSALFLLGEAALGSLIILRVPYTEIDWIAYMQEVGGWVGPDGTTDYMLLAGDTGPLVYPAGFLYIYAPLRWLVGNGGRGPAAIRMAQWIFLALYLVVQGLVLQIYAITKPGPPWAVLILAWSKRVHSLFVLRMFNDCFAMAFAYAAVLLFAHHKVGCVYGLSVLHKTTAAYVAHAPMRLILSAVAGRLCHVFLGRQRQNECVTFCSSTGHSSLAQHRRLENDCCSESLLVHPGNDSKRTCTACSVAITSSLRSDRCFLVFRFS